MALRNRLALGLLIVLTAAAAVVYYPSGEGDADSSDPERRVAAARELAGKTDEASLEVLTRLSDDPEPRVSLTAVKAIGRGRTHERNRKVLTRILTEARSGVARAAAAAALGECPEVDAKVLTHTLLSDRDAQARAGAAKGLARRRDKATLPQLVKALEDPDPRVRLWAITAIRRITAFHFKYDAARPPERQRDEIAFIKETLRQRSGLRR